MSWIITVIARESGASMKGMKNVPNPKVTIQVTPGQRGRRFPPGEVFRPRCEIISEIQANRDIVGNASKRPER